MAVLDSILGATLVISYAIAIALALAITRLNFGFRRAATLMLAASVYLGCARFDALRTALTGAVRIR